MCKLMTTIGGKLEAYDQRKKKGALMKEYFGKIGALSDDHPSSRMRYVGGVDVVGGLVGG